jgi:hypothetical protein
MITTFSQNIALGNIPVGSYTVIVTTTLNGTFQDQNTQNITVGSCCNALATITQPDTMFCNSGTINYLLTQNSPNATSFAWFINGDPVSTAAAYNFSMVTSGIYNITLQASNGTCSTMDSIQVRLDNPVSVSLGQDQVICAGTSKVLNATVFNPNAIYTWSTGSAFPMISVTSSGTYSVTVTAGACSDSDTIVLTNAQGSVANLGEDTQLCSGETLLLDASNGVAGLTFLWNNGSTDSTLLVTSAGNYSVQVTSPTGCISTDAIVITYASLVNIGLPNEVVTCAGTSVTLTPNNFIGATYLWNNGTTSASLTANNAGTYILNVTFSNDCVQTDTVVVTVPTPSVNFPDSAVAFNDGTTVTIDAGAGFVNYLWSTGATTQTIAISNIGTYSVTVTDVNGCVATDSITFSFPSNLTNARQLDLKIYPNPATDRLILDGLTDFSSVEIAITNALGQVVLRDKITDSFIEVAQLPKGWYQLTITQEKQSIVLPFVKI